MKFLKLFLLLSFASQLEANPLAALRRAPQLAFRCIKQQVRTKGNYAKKQKGAKPVAGLIGHAKKQSPLPTLTLATPQQQPQTLIVDELRQKMKRNFSKQEIEQILQKFKILLTGILSAEIGYVYGYCKSSQEHQAEKTLLIPLPEFDNINLQ